ncbi:hypothetical protein V8D89_000358 [Ganoderma adspersum]
MSFVYLAKVLALAVIVAAEYTHLRAPNPVPKSEDRRKFGGESEFLARVVHRFPQLAMATNLWFHLGEAATILALAFPSPLSTRVLSALLKDPSRIDHLAISPAFVVGLVLVVVGAVWRKKCYDALGRFFTFQLALHKEHKLITTGPYAIVRHPSYAAFLMVEAGCLITLMLPGSYVYESGMPTTLWGAVPVLLWAVTHATINLIAVTRVPVEDAVLRREFGSQWDAWARKTPYALIPYVY